MRRLSVVATALVVVSALAACSSTSTPGPAGDREGSAGTGHRTDASPTADPAGPVTTRAEASCVESYSPQGVARRAFAFDGVVVQTGPSVSDRDGSGQLGLPGVTFEVREWFSGGRGDTVTVDFQGADDDPSEVGSAIGTRLLVSGEPRWGGAPLDAPIAWSCGFTRRWDEATATAWREATRR